jgi:transposase
VQINDISDLGGWEGYRVVGVEQGSAGTAITLQSQRGRFGVCPKCGDRTSQVHDYRWRTVRDLPLFGSPITLKVERRRLRCPQCGAFTEDLPWLGARSRLTQRLSAAVAGLCRHMALKHVAEFFGLGWDAVKSADKDALERLLSGYDPRTARILAMDEFAIRRGHRYASVVIDVESGTVLWVGRGRSRESIRPFFAMMGSEACSRIEAVAIDCTATYALEIHDHCPNALIIYDLFHIVARYGKEVIDRVRVDEANRLKDDRAGRKLVKGARWLLLRNPENLARPEDRVRLQELLAANRSLAKAYIMKDDLKLLWSFRNEEEAALHWKQWHYRAVRSRIPPLVHFAKNLVLWRDGIIAHCRYPIHTSIIEGVNNKIKVIKRMAYGFRDDAYFFLKIRAAFYHPDSG